MMGGGAPMANPHGELPPGHPHDGAASPGHPRMQIAGVLEPPVLLDSPPTMPDYNKLREMVSHRTTFEFDTGAKVVGYIGSCAPAHGPVQLVVLSKVQLLDSSNNIVAQYAELPLIPNNLIGFRVTEGPS